MHPRTNLGWIWVFPALPVSGNLVQANESDPIEKRPGSSVGVAFVVTALSILASVMASAIVGHVDQSLLGMLGYLRSLIALVPTFFVLGGEAVLLRYVPQLAETAKRGFITRFSLTNVALALGMTAFLLYNRGIALRMFGLPPSETVLVTFTALVALPVVGHSMATAAAAGLLKLKMSSVLSQATQPALLAVLAFFAFAPSGGGLSRETLVLAVGLAQVLAGTLAVGVVWSLLKRGRGSWSPLNSRFPAGFWPFTLALHVGTIGTFAAQRLDSLLVASWHSFSALGVYFAGTQIAGLISTPSQLISRTLFPLVSRQRSGHSDAGVETAEMIRVGLAFSVAAYSVIVCLPEVVLGVFGLRSPGQSTLLVTLGYGAVISAVNQPCSVVVLAHGKAHWGLYNHLSTLSVYFSSLWLLNSWLGINGMALARLLATMAAGAGALLFVRLLERQWPAPSTVVGLAVGALWFVMEFVWCRHPEGIRFAGRTAEVVVGWIVMSRAGVIRKSDVTAVRKLIVERMCSGNASRSSSES